MAKTEYNLVCNFCKTDFITRNKNAKFCSLQCYFDSKKQIIIEKTCLVCGKTFLIAKSQEHKYSTCSKSCSLEYQKCLGKEKCKSLTYICKYCGDEYLVKKHYMKIK